jgi:hypothetical protein
MLIYEGDVIHHFKATELSCVRIVITFIASFISCLERCIKPSLQLAIAKRKPWFREKRKNEEIISRNCLPHHKRASTFFNMQKAARLHLLAMWSRYYPMSDSVQRDEQYRVQKENPDFKRREKIEEIISSTCLPYHKTARTFINTLEAARLHLLTMLLRYCPMSASVKHDEQCSSLHAEELRTCQTFTEMLHICTTTNTVHCLWARVLLHPGP